MSLELISQEDNDWLTTEGKLVLQLENGNRVAVGLPFAVEHCEPYWWLCCLQGKFALRMDKPCLFSRELLVHEQHWIHVLDAYQGQLLKITENGEVSQFENPTRIPVADSAWLLNFLRQCSIVPVLSSIGSSTTVDVRTGLPIKSSRGPLVPVRVRSRSYRRRLYQR
jgi:hypothetical protein